MRAPTRVPAAKSLPKLYDENLNGLIPADRVEKQLGKYIQAVERDHDASQDLAHRLRCKELLIRLSSLGRVRVSVDQVHTVDPALADALKHLPTEELLKLAGSPAEATS